MPIRRISPPSPDEKNQITEVTRRSIVDELTVGKVSWSGRFDEADFLSRLFDLKKLPSKDYRYTTAGEDIWKHRTMNNDWPDDWVFYDDRFDILHGPDERFLRFLCEMVHPVVRPDADEAAKLVALFNLYLASDGWEIVETTRISDKPVYAARPFIAASAGPVKAAKEVAFTLDAAYVSQQITRMESAINTDPELAIGTAKEFLETVCKTILSERKVQYDKDETLPKLAKLVHCFFRITNREQERELEINNRNRTDPTRIIDNLGNEYPAVAVKLGASTDEARASSIFPPDIPILGSATFENVAGTHIAMLEINIDRGWGIIRIKDLDIVREATP